MEKGEREREVWDEVGEVDSSQTVEDLVSHVKDLGL